MQKNHRRLTNVLLLASGMSGGSLTAATYRITELGTLGGTYSQATAINARGQIVGIAQLRQSYGSHPVLFSGTGTGNIDLGGLPGGPPDPYAVGSCSISNSGQIVGTSPSGSSPKQATLYSGTGTGNVELGTLPGAFSYESSTATSVNSKGQIVGSATAGHTVDHATLFTGTGTGNIDLGVLPDQQGDVESLATAINDRGQIVGYARTAAFSIGAVLFSGTGTGNIALGALPDFPQSGAFAISSDGRIVGVSDITDFGRPRATLFSGTGMGNTDLGLLPGGRGSYAIGVNATGQIVGYADFAGQTFHGFLYQNGAMADLNDLIPPGSGWVITAGNAINDAGQIVVSATKEGADQALLLTPLSGVTVTVSQHKRTATFTIANTGAMPATFLLRRSLNIDRSFHGSSGPNPGNRNIITYSLRGANITKALAAGRISVALATGGSARVEVKAKTHFANIHLRTIHAKLSASSRAAKASATATIKLRPSH